MASGRSSRLYTVALCPSSSSSFILDYNRWDRGLPGGTPGTTTIIICTTWCARRYISRVRSFRVLIFMYWAKVSSWYYDGRSCSICTRCFHRCSARIPTITAIEVSHVFRPVFPPAALLSSPHGRYRRASQGRGQEREVRITVSCAPPISCPILVCV